MRRTMKKVKRRTVTGNNVYAYRKGRVSLAVCNNCGRQLHGIPNVNKSFLSKLSKTEKRPNRKFGGYYCSDCAKELFRENARRV